MFKRIDHVEIVPTDMERSLAFYQDVLGFSLRARDRLDAPPLREVVYLQLGDSLLELLDVESPQPSARHAWPLGYRMMALEVDDMSEAIAWLGERGVEPSWGPVEREAYARAEIRDPDGLPIEIRQWKRARPSI
jgi:catechol 2,3-dioxygenase-like lactoylglutathione lyase family enzyme